jgi:DNA replication protein DnaC
MKWLNWGRKNKTKGDASKEGIPSSSFGFNPLYPSSLDREHGVYAETLCGAIKDERVKNIALTGSYGTGKSSILDIFERKNEGRVIHISFSSLGAKIEEKIIDIEDKSDDETGAIRNL